MSPHETHAPWDNEGEPEDEREGYGPLRVATEEDGQHVIAAWASEWGAPKAVHAAAEIIAAEPDVFLDRSKNLIWVDDRGGLGASMKLLKPDDLDYLLHRAGVRFERFERKDGATKTVATGTPKALRYAAVAELLARSV
jgi:hypothetical protein